MPAELVGAYTRGDASAAAETIFVDDTRGGLGLALRHSQSSVTAAVAASARGVASFKARHGGGGAGARDPADAREWLVAALLRAGGVAGARAVVLGSSSGAEEALLLALGAASVTVVEHLSVAVEHPQVTSLTVGAARRAYCGANASAAWRRFDVALSMSAFDHDGLGRYGDALSPDADLVAMDELRCEYLARPGVRVGAAGADDDEQGGGAAAGGLAVVSVPVGPDAVVWNAMRRYGPVRLPLFLAGYDVVGSVGFDERKVSAAAPLRGKSYEPVFLLRPALAAADDAACAAARRINCDEAELPLEQLGGGGQGA